MTIILATSESDGDTAAAEGLASFDEVYRLHAGRVHRFCVSQVGDQTVAQDLTHQTFLRAFGAYQRVRPDPETVRTWLLTIARNLSTDHHRHRGRWRRLLARGRDSPSMSRDVEEVVQQRAELERITVALRALRARDRQLIGLRVAADLSYREIAGVLGVSESVAKVATFRALTRLRAHLEESP